MGFENLADLGLFIRDVLGDGNCFFRAVSIQLYGTDRYHAFLRYIVCQYMAGNEEELAPFLSDIDTGSEGFQAYVNNMYTDGTWAGNLEILVTTIVTRRDIRIYQEDAPMQDINTNGEDPPSILLAYNGEHYDTVLPISQNINDENENSYSRMVLENNINNNSDSDSDSDNYIYNDSNREGDANVEQEDAERADDNSKDRRPYMWR